MTSPNFLDMDAPDAPPTGLTLHDRAAEQHVLSCLLLDPQQATLAPECFYFPEHRLLYLSIQRLQTANRPVELASIAADLEDHGQFQTTGGWPFLFQIEARDQIPTTLHLRHYADRIAALSDKRTRVAHAQATIAAISEGRTPPPPPAIHTPAVNDAAALKSRRITLASNPTEPTTRLFLAGKPVATPGNLTTLISKAKTGKTATIGSVVAAIVGAHYDRPNLDTFGFTAPHTKEAVILLDTEQSLFDAFTCHKRAFARAGQTEDVEWLHHYSLVGYTADRLRKLLPVILAEAKARHGAVFTVILDGVADFVASVNDEQECNTFVAELHGTAVSYDCPILCVIHSNEAQKSGDDGRGHLGKQLTRKAESNLLLKKDGEITTITSEKQRKAPITEADGISFKWDDAVGRHISCSVAKPKTTTTRRRSFTFDQFSAIFPRSADKAMTKQALLRFATDITPIKDPEFTAILHDAVERGELIRTAKTGGFYYHLNVP